MTELFNELAIEEDRVVYLLASLPVFPRWRLLHSEREQKDKSSIDFSEKQLSLKVEV